MSKRKLPSVEELLERKNWSGLTGRELAKTGRVGDPSEVATNIVENLGLFSESVIVGFDDMVWDLVKKLRGLERDLTAELRRLSEDKEEGK